MSQTVGEQLVIGFDEADVEPRVGLRHELQIPVIEFDADH
jgi:hypothetical protein